MKSKMVLVYLIGSWILFIAFDSTGGMLRSWYLRKMNVPFRFLYRATNILRSFIIFTIAVLNFFIIAKRMNEKSTTI